ncbi:MAG: S8 family serine peptidase, partial [Anaerolineae bacterium]|nr:S8 family serine peptidase [Anaerolineae bacterium]
MRIQLRHFLLVVLGLVIVPNITKAQDIVLYIDYIHTIEVNGQEAEAIVEGIVDLQTGIVEINSTISHYIDGYQYWPTGWITLIMTSVMPAVSLERGDAYNLLTLTDGELGYQVNSVMSNQYALVTTNIDVQRDEDTIIARLVSQGQANFPDIIGMGEGTLEIVQMPNAEGGFTETGIKELVATDGELIEIEHYAEFIGVDLPAPQQRSLRITLLDASDDLTEISLRYEGLVEPRAYAEFERDYYFANDRRVPVLISLNEIGLVTTGRGNIELAARLAEESGLEIVEEVTDGFFVAQLPEPMSRRSLKITIQELKQNFPNDVEVGALLYPFRSTDIPMLLTNEFIVQFQPNITQETIDEYNSENNVEIVSKNPFFDNQFVVTVGEESDEDALTMANRYHENNFTLYSEPNLWQVIVSFQDFIPNDPIFAAQWHHLNSTGLVDADADTSLAWSINQGSGNVVIGIIDDGFDINHEDLQPNLFTNPGEIPNNGIDDDMNGFVDDVNGWDVTTCSSAVPAGCGDNNPQPGGGDNHGTAVAGVAIARGSNNIGIVGSCPNCLFLPIRRPFGVTPTTVVARTFEYAIAMRNAGINLAVLNNSWGYSNPANVVPTTVANAINAATNAGIVVLFAGGNQNSAGWCNASLPSLANIITVSSSTSLDQKAIGGSGFDGSAFGNCIDLLAPSFHVDAGTLGITTTDRSGNAGYNGIGTICVGGLPEQTDTNYTNCFGGTSSATPLTSGVVGLILSSNQSLSNVDVQRLLQDTADKIEPGIAAYDESSGFSSPATGIATHSWGRLNAFEALRIAAPITDGGHGGVDIFIRDNQLDWGNTTGYLGEQGSNVLFESPRSTIPHWRSVDIRVDAP